MQRLLRIQEEAFLGQLVLNSTSELYHDAKTAEANLKSETLGSRQTRLLQLVFIRETAKHLETSGFWLEGVTTSWFLNVSDVCALGIRVPSRLLSA